MSYTEFFCDPVNGNNLNGGRPIGGAYPIAYTNGGYDQTTGVFTVAGGNPINDGVQVGDYAAVMLDGASSSLGLFIGRITARDATTITVSLSVACGSAPATGATGRTIRVGGAWKGPNGAEQWPTQSSLNSLWSAAGGDAPPRVNLKNNASYLTTVALGVGASFITWEGYSAAPGDGGRATIDAQGNAVNVWSPSSSDTVWRNLIFVNSAAAGSNDGLSMTGSNNIVEGCVAHGMRGRGFNNSGTTPVYIGCEAYDCNKSNTANLGGFASSVAATYVNCISHDNGGSNGHGFACTGSVALTMIDCIAESNGGSGLFASSGGKFLTVGCDFYNNGASGVDLSAALSGRVQARNCNFLKNADSGVKALSGNNLGQYVLRNCGFGRGTQANGTDLTNLPVLQNVNPVIYAADVTPWVDPANGDFRVSLAAAKGTGIGSFTQTAGGYAGTIAYPDIGAAQHREVSGAPAARTRITTPGVLCG